MAESYATLSVGEAEYHYVPILQHEGASKLPYTLRVLLENCLRTIDDPARAATCARRIVEAATSGTAGEEIEFSPARVLFQDFTGVPVFVDFAVMREACAQLGGDPACINPQIPCDLVVDHSIIADEFGCASALERNKELEFSRNKERYSFLKWAQSSFKNVRITPPGAGICHQLNIEAFAPVVMTRLRPDAPALAYFDTLVGTDSHTPTANGLGVLGWGVGGIEAEAAALGQAITILVPRVVGLHVTGNLSGRASAMDVSLKLAQLLREQGVVGAFVECFGEGVASLTATQRACIANMTPEYGSTATFFPIDEQTISYLQLTGRSDEQCALVEAYAKAQGLWHNPSENRNYALVLELNLSDITPALAGPSRPQDYISAQEASEHISAVCATRRGGESPCAEVDILGEKHQLKDGAVALAAITSCTTATDPAMMLACGLLARRAAQRGLTPKPWVKCVLAPGSHATSSLLARAGLQKDLESLGFYTCGFGCMSCIGNSGPLLPRVSAVADQIELASVLSGNRNFEGRISPDVAQNYLAAPALVVAYALAGRMDFDFAKEALGLDQEGSPVFLDDIWPDQDEIAKLLADVLAPSVYVQANAHLYDGDAHWKALPAPEGQVFNWDDASTYVRRASYFDSMTLEPAQLEPIADARVLLHLGDFITTDHISPAGSIASDSAAADYLRKRGVKDEDFNTYGTRRGNHEVMARGTFANVKLQNKLSPGYKGAWTRDFTKDEVTRIFEQSERYAEDELPLVVLAGKMYGSGSSRDWAAKGPLLLGVRAVLAESFERIHRSNLIGMGILPLEFLPGESVETHKLTGYERFDIAAPDVSSQANYPSRITVCANRPDGTKHEFTMIARIDTPTEGQYLQHGGILQYVLRRLSAS